MCTILKTAETFRAEMISFFHKQIDLQGLDEIHNWVSSWSSVVDVEYVQSINRQEKQFANLTSPSRKHWWTFFAIVGYFADRTVNSWQTNWDWNKLLCYATWTKQLAQLFCPATMMQDFIIKPAQSASYLSVCQAPFLLLVVCLWQI